MQYKVKDNVWAVVSSPPMKNVPISAISCSSDNAHPVQVFYIHLTMKILRDV